MLARKKEKERRRRRRNLFSRRKANLCDTPLPPPLPFEDVMIRVEEREEEEGKEEEEEEERSLFLSSPNLCVFFLSWEASPGKAGSRGGTSLGVAQLRANNRREERVKRGSWGGISQRGKK